MRFIYVWALMMCVIMLAFVQRVSHNQYDFRNSLEITMASQSLLLDLLNAQRGERGYVITGDETFLDPYYSGRARIGESERRLLVATDPREQILVEKITSIAEEEMLVLDEVVAVSKEKGLEEGRQIISLKRGKRPMDKVAFLIQELQTSQAKKVDEAKAATAENLGILRVGIIVGIFVTLLDFGLSLHRWWKDKRLVERVRHERRASLV